MDTDRKQRFSSFFSKSKAAYGTGDFATSLATSMEAYKINPSHAVLNGNIAAILYEMGRFQESESFAKQAIQLSPEYNRPHITLGMLYLLKGDYQSGWPEYEWVSTLQKKFTSMPAERMWQGESIDGQKIVLIDEQGYGDTLQFLRFAPAVSHLGGEVFLNVKQPLRRLVEFNSEVGIVLQKGEKVDLNKWARLLSIPRIINAQASDLVKRMPYLKAPPLTKKSVVNQAAGRKVGIIWKGSDANARDAIRSLTVADLTPLLSLARDQSSDWSFYHLQNQSFATDIEAAGLTDCLTELHDEIEDFADLAALIDAMDLVVCVDTAVAHLAGALGKPVLCLISHVADWRWGDSAETSEWYPRTLLFRQPQPGDWASPVADLLKEMTKEENWRGSKFRSSAYP